MIGIAEKQLLKDGLRLLMFHDINAVSNSHDSDIYKMGVDKFKIVLESLCEMASTADLPFTTLTGSRTRGIVLTFDDGLRSIADYVFPILADLHIPFHIFVSTEGVSKTRSSHLSPRLIRDLANSSLVSIGSHGHEHRALTSLDREETRRNLTTSKNLLEEWTQKEIDSLAYPHGRYSSEVSQISKAVGFRFACTSLPGTFVNQTDPLAIPRIDIWASDRVIDIKGKLAGTWNRTLRYAYLRSIDE